MQVRALHSNPQPYSVTRLQIQRENPESAPLLSSLRGDTVSDMLGDLAGRKEQAEVQGILSGFAAGVGVATGLLGLATQTTGLWTSGAVIGAVGLGIHLFTRFQGQQADQARAALDQAAHQVDARLCVQQGDQTVNRRFLELPAFRNPTQILDAKTGAVLSSSVELEGLRVEERNGMVTLDDGQQQTQFAGTLTLPTHRWPEVTIAHSLEQPVDGLNRTELSLTRDGKKQLGIVGDTKWDSEGVSWTPGLVFRPEEYTHPGWSSSWETKGNQEIAARFQSGKVTIPSPVELDSLVQGVPLKLSGVSQPMQPRVG